MTENMFEQWIHKIARLEVVKCTIDSATKPKVECTKENQTKLYIHELAPLFRNVSTPSSA